MAEPQVSDALQAGFTDAVGQRARAKELEALAAMLKEEANEVIKAFFLVAGVREGVVAGIGAVKYVTRVQKTLDRKAFRESLVRAGLNADKVAACEVAAVTETASHSISFYPEKGEGA